LSYDIWIFVNFYKMHIYRPLPRAAKPVGLRREAAMRLLH